MTFLAAVVAATLGTFCVDGDCRPAARMPARVAPAAQARTFVWMDRERVLLGTIAPDAVRVTPSAEPHPLTVRLSDAAEAPVNIEVAATERKWTFTVRAKSKLALTLVHPSCACTVTARAAEYAQATGALGAELLLRRLPVIRGVVVDAKAGVPLARAEITLGERKAITGEDGAFRIAIDGDWPAHAQVTHPARAPKLVSVPKAAADTTLPPIAMTAGGTMQLTIAPPLGGAEPLKWELRTDSTLVRSGELPQGVATARVEALDPGAYRLIVQGREPLQRFARGVTIRESEVVETAIAITPVAVDGEVTFDGALLPSAEVGFRGQGWESELTAGEDGRFHEELWQPGTFKVNVVHPPLVRVWGTDWVVDGDDERVELALHIPNRRVRGRVTDARTGAPVADAIVQAMVPFGDRSSIQMRTRSAADGSYEFTGVEPGNVTLSAMKKGYRFPAERTFVLAEDESVREEPLSGHELAVQRTVLVTDARGIPIAGASVLNPQLAATTDGQGRATLYFDAPEPRGRVFVVPRSGSLGFATIGADEVVPVRVADAASLELRMESTGGTPIQDIAVGMRIDGTPIPDDVMAELTRLQGVPLASDSSGRVVYPRMPAGQYELMPRMRRGKTHDHQPPPPVRVAVLPGPQTVVMKFEPK
ncbi:MAG TPA: carboxypeptidase-like regulatory domain-containing protein [Thermoanaerobaculia bacterium]|jgi:hypothetical protein